MGAKQQKYTVIPGGEAGRILPPEGCSRESRTVQLLCSMVLFYPCLHRSFNSTKSEQHSK